MSIDAFQESTLGWIFTDLDVFYDTLGNSVYVYMYIYDLGAIKYYTLSVSLPTPSLLGLVSRLQPWLLGTLARLSDGVEVTAVVRGTLPYV